MLKSDSADGLVSGIYYRYATLPKSCQNLIITQNLQIAVSDINKYAFTVEGAETIARTISRYGTFEQIYLRHQKMTTKAIKELETALVKLYATTLIYFTRMKQYFEQGTASEFCRAVCTS